MKCRRYSDFHDNAQQPPFPASGKVFLVLAFFLLTLSQPLFGQSPTGIKSTAQQGCRVEDALSGTAAESPAPATAEPNVCFDRVWSAYQKDVWFYGENGQPTIPAMAPEWLVVRLAKMGTADEPSSVPFEKADTGGSEQQPPSFASFNAHYGEYFSHFLQDPAESVALAAYRLRRDMPEEVFRTLMTRLAQDRQVSYVHPAWKIAGKLYVPREKIEVTWKTAADLQQRRSLLEAVGALGSTAATASNPQQISIDPCRQSVWQSANLLADDILVKQARPLLWVLEPPVGARFELAMNGATIGTPIPFTLEIRFSDRVKIESSTLANLSLQPAGIFHNLYEIRYDVPLSSIDMQRSPILISGELIIYASGEYSLPGIPVYYTDSRAPNSRMQLLKTAGTPIRIAAMIPTAAEGFELKLADFGPLSVRTPASVTTATPSSVLLISAGLLLTGLSVVTLWLLRKRYVQPETPAQNHILMRSRARVAAAVSAMQKQRGMTELAELGLSLKDYLAELTGLDKERRGGNHASFFRRIESALPDSCRQPTAELLSQIEHLLAQGAESTVPEDLADRVGRLVEELQIRM